MSASAVGDTDARVAIPENPVDAKGARFLATIREAAQRMADLIDDLLALSRAPIPPSCSAFSNGCIP